MFVFVCEVALTYTHTRSTCRISKWKWYFLPGIIVYPLTRPKRSSNNERTKPGKTRRTPTKRTREWTNLIEIFHLGDRISCNTSNPCHFKFASHFVKNECYFNSVKRTLTSIAGVLLLMPLYADVECMHFQSHKCFSGPTRSSALVPCKSHFCYGDASQISHRWKIHQFAAVAFRFGDVWQCAATGYRQHRIRAQIFITENF